MQLAVAHDEVDAAQDLAILGADVEVADLELTGHYAATAFRSVAGIRSARLVSCSVLTIAARTRVHRTLVVQTWLGVGLARAADRAVGRARDALDRRDPPLERLDDLGHRDLRRLAREQIAAVGPAAALDQPGTAQPRDEMLEIGEGEPLAVGDLGERHRVGAAAPREIDHHAHAVLGSGGEHHRIKPTSEVGYQWGRTCAPRGRVGCCASPRRQIPVACVGRMSRRTPMRVRH